MQIQYPLEFLKAMTKLHVDRSQEGDKAAHAYMLR